MQTALLPYDRTDSRADTEEIPTFEVTVFLTGKDPVMEDNLARELASWWRSLYVGELLNEAIPPTDSDLVVDGHIYLYS